MKMVGKCLRAAAVFLLGLSSFTLYVAGQSVTTESESHGSREIGVQSFIAGDYPKAKEELLQALSEDSTDSRTILYLGLTYESLGNDQKAIQAYSHARFSHPGTTEELILDARRHSLGRQVIRQDIRSGLDNANSLPDSALQPATIAVFPLVLTGSNRHYQSLGYGISEVLVQDLKKIPHVRVIDPLRVYTLLHALSSTQLQYIDPVLATKLGKILGAGYIVGGSYDVQSDAQLSINFTRWDLINVNFPQPAVHMEAVDHLDSAIVHLLKDALTLMDQPPVALEASSADLFPTNDPEAFLAFSRGLEEEYGGSFSRAADDFRAAAAHDPYFESAQSHRDMTNNLSHYGGSLETVIAQLTGEPITQSPPLLLLRLNHLGTSLGMNFGFGPETRAAVEGFTITPLPLPPAPPVR